MVARSQNDTFAIVNPVISDYKIHDVSLIQDKDAYYLVSSCNSSRDKNEKIPYYGANLFKSNNLVNWHYIRQSLDLSALGDFKLWAPDIIKYKHKYLIFAAFRKSMDDTKIAVYECDSITGSFRFVNIVVSNDKSDGKAFFNSREMIDPCPIIDKGRLYLVFGSFARDGDYKKNRNRSNIGVYIVRLNPNDCYSMIGKPKFLTDFYEGVSIIKRKGTYYLFGTNGAWTNHSYKIAYASSRNIDGPYYNAEGLAIADTIAVNPGNVILQTKEASLRYNGFGCMSQPVIDRNGRYWVMVNGHDITLPPITDKSSQRERYIHLIELKWDDNDQPYFDLDEIENNKNYIIF